MSNYTETLRLIVNEFEGERLISELIKYIDCHKKDCTYELREQLRKQQIVISKQEVKTLRDEIAIAAMQGMYNHAAFSGWSIEDIATEAYKMADEMLKQRSKKT